MLSFLGLFQDLQHLLADNSENLTLYAARFNARLLGAISVGENEGGNISLNHLCVRQLTRQRHVGRDLLRLLISHLSQEKAVSFKLETCMQNPALDKLLKN